MIAIRQLEDMPMHSCACFSPVEISTAGTCLTPCSVLHPVGAVESIEIHNKREEMHSRHVVDFFCIAFLLYLAICGLNIQILLIDSCWIFSPTIQKIS